MAKISWDLIDNWADKGKNGILTEIVMHVINDEQEER